jgi:hypothetical protein
MGRFNLAPDQKRMYSWSREADVIEQVGENTVKKALISISIALNIFISLPSILVLTQSQSVQYELYHNVLAPRLGKPEIVFIGDSLTRGGWIWGPRIGRFDFNVWNRGRNGYTTKQINHFANQFSSETGTKYIFVMAGVNDSDKSKAGISKTFADYRHLLEIMVSKGVTPVIQSTLYRENEQNPEFFDELNARLKQYAEKHEMPYIDLNVALAPEKSLLPEYSRDGTHLTSEAYKVWGKKVRELENQFQ